MRGASNPDDRTAAPGLLPATRARGRNDGQGIGLLVSACRVSLATVRREVDRAIDQRRLDAPDRHIHPNSRNLETAPGAVNDALERADLNAADPPLQGTARSSAIPDQRFRRHRDIDRRNCRRSSEAENYPARKALETLKTGKSARGRRAQSTDALERADLNAADRPLEGVGAIERYHAPSVAAPSRNQPSQSSPPFERDGNFPGRKALKIHKTAKESRFDSILSRLISITKRT